MENKNKELNQVLEKMNKGRSYRKTQQFEARTIGDEENEELIVEGYATLFNQPYELYRCGNDWIVNEQIDPHAFDTCDMSDVIMQYDHQGRVYARNKNNTLEVDVDEKGLHFKADLGGTEIGRQLYEEIKGGYTTKMSFGFTVEEDTREYNDNYDTGVTTVLRTIKKFGKLYDVSAVSIPANDATEISARSFGEGVIKEIEAERLERARTKRMEEEILTLLSL